MSNSHTPVDHPSWIYPDEDPDLSQTIIEEFHIHPVTANVLVARGLYDLGEIHQFLYGRLPNLHDPFLLDGMGKSVQRIAQAMENQEAILVYGDNDVDGMTGTALLIDFLETLGADVEFFVSNRGIAREDLLVEALESPQTARCSLVITVDCGVTATQEIEELAKLGIDVIVTDHHEPSDTIPQSVATLNPKLVDSHYPNRELTGVGVAFKLAHGLLTYLTRTASPPKIDLKSYLDLVAIGTIADMGILQGENRILVRYGLEQIRSTKRVGLSKLMSVSDVSMEQVQTSDIVFKLAPRLNSLGRIDDPRKGVELLLHHNSKQATKMAHELNVNNAERQRIERSMTVHLEEMMEQHPEILQEKAIVLHSSLWHPGVIPILSTRLTKQYMRPCVMIALENGVGKGSLRSIPQFPLLPALRKCQDLLKNYGGHDLAAGMTIEEEYIEPFKKRLIALATQSLSDEDVASRIVLDSYIEFEDLTFELLESNQLLEPFGNGNFPPLFYTKARQAWPPKLIGKNHLKLFLEQKDRILEGVFMNRSDDRQRLKQHKGPLLIAFTPQVNLFQKDSIQLLVKEYQILAEE